MSSDLDDTSDASLERPLRPLLLAVGDFVLVYDHLLPKVWKRAPTHCLYLESSPAPGSFVVRILDERSGEVRRSSLQWDGTVFTDDDSDRVVYRYPVHSDADLERPRFFGID